MYYPSSENKGADQLRGYREADLRLCFRLCRLLVFPWGGSFIRYPSKQTAMTDITQFAVNKQCQRGHETGQLVLVSLGIIAHLYSLVRFFLSQTLGTFCYDTIFDDSLKDKVTVRISISLIAPNLHQNVRSARGTTFDHLEHVF